jgi:1,6-anhydro-N-acetylmuramate kinase
MDRTRLVLGAMTGTSIDGIDLAVARIEGSGTSMRAAPVAFRSAPLGDLAPRLRAAAEQRPAPAGEFAALARDLGLLHAREASALLRESGIAAVDLAAVHGQTVFHRPPVSWQLVNAHAVAEALGCDVVFDLRAHDLAAGGEGAPLTPLADWVLFRAGLARAVVNLGGFANATVLPADDGRTHDAQVASIRGADLCPCNQLLDRAARATIGRDYDPDGATAAGGARDASAFAELAALLAPRPGARSLGTGDELFAWVDRHAPRMRAADLLATAADAVGAAVGAALAAHGAHEAILAGGGARHARLRGAIAAASGIPVRASGELGVPASGREALEWAVLGALAADGVEVGIPGVTRRPGHSQSLPGAWIRSRRTPNRP